MSEETHDAAMRGPLAIRLAILVSGLVGWMLTITFCFCLTDSESILNSATGLPVAQIFLNAGGRVGGTAMWFFVVLIQFFTGCSAMLANARMTYAFARDNGLPFSAHLSRINPHTSTPTNAVWLVVTFCACLNLIGIGSRRTIYSIFNITAPALDLSYVAVIVARRVYEGRGTVAPFAAGPYTLGRWSKLFNAVACFWVLFISVILFFPTHWPVDAANMNYAVVVAAAIALFSFGWWWISGRGHFNGSRPVRLEE